MTRWTKLPGRRFHYQLINKAKFPNKYVCNRELRETPHGERENRKLSLVETPQAPGGTFDTHKNDSKRKYGVYKCVEDWGIIWWRAELA